MKTAFFLTVILMISVLLMACQPLDPQQPDEAAEPVPQESPDEGDTKILFVGNSLTFYNSMPDIFHHICTTAGKHVWVEQASLAGKSLRQLIESDVILKKIASREWDIVVLQSDDITAFPDMIHMEELVVQRFKNVIVQKSPHATIWYQLLWGLRDGVEVLEINGQKIYYSYEEYFEKIRKGTVYLASKCSVNISPVGWAWQTIRRSHPEIDLFSGDGAHPGPEGSFLTAAVHFSAIYHESCSGLEPNSELSESLVTILLDAASETVLNQEDAWRESASNTGINQGGLQTM